MKGLKDTKKVLKLDNLKHRKDGGGEDPKRILSEGEKVQVAVMLERLTALETQTQQIRLGLADLIRTIVVSRGLDDSKFGVNLAAGRILPIDKGNPTREVEPTE